MTTHGASRTTHHAPRLQWIDLGLRPYEAVLELQQQLVVQRQRGEGVDTLLLCEHPPCYTLGAGAVIEDLRGVRDVPIYRVGRGGGATYHGPGQLVGYPILRLRDRGWPHHLPAASEGSPAPKEIGLRPIRQVVGWRVSDYLYALERALIATTRTFGVDAHNEGPTRGVYVADRKLASIGIQVSQGVVWHGFALNVSCDLALFSRITPCHQPNIRMTSLTYERGAPLSAYDVQHNFVAQWARYMAVAVI